MNFKFLYRSVESLIVDPSEAWDKILADNKGTGRINSVYLLPLVALIALSAFLGNVLFNRTEVSVLYFLLDSITYFLLFYFSIYVTAWLSARIMVTIKLPVSFAESFRLITFSVTPFLVCQIISRLFESFIFVNILAFYGLYIFWTGEVKLNIPRDKRFIMLTASTALFISSYIVGNWLLAKVADGIYFTFFS
ncbi:MAG: YIP1 family protein [Bacteroidales bacterium]